MPDLWIWQFFHRVRFDLLDCEILHSRWIQSIGFLSRWFCILDSDPPVPVSFGKTGWPSVEGRQLTEYYIVRKTKIGEMAEWSIALVLKTRSLQGLRGSNPLLSSRT